MSQLRPTYIFFADDPIAQFALADSFSHNPLEMDFLADNMHLIPQFMYFATNGDPRIQIAGLRGFENFVLDVFIPPQKFRCEALPVLGSLIQQSTNPEITQVAIRLIGRIAGIGSWSRDLVLESQVCVSLYEVSAKLVAQESWKDQIDLLRILADVLFKLTRGSPSPQFSFLRPFLPFLSKLLFTCSGDEKILTDTLRIFAVLADGENERIQAVLDCGIMPQLGELVENCEIRDKEAFIQPMVQLLGNIASGEEEQTQTLIDSGILVLSVRWINHPSQFISKDALFLISNVAAGNEAQIQSVIDLGILPHLLEMVQDERIDDQFLIMREILWVVGNICESGSGDQIGILLELGVVKAISRAHLFTLCGHKEISVILDAHKNLLERSKLYNRLDQVKVLMAEADLPKLLRSLLATSETNELGLSLNNQQKWTVEQILAFFSTKVKGNFNL